MDVTLEVLNEKLDRLLNIPPAQAPAPMDPWEHPEVPPSRVTAFDNQTIQLDGSIWALNNDGIPMGEQYGYYSRGRCGERVWQQMVYIVAGKSGKTLVEAEAELVRLIESSPYGRRSRFKLSPEVFFDMGESAYMMLSQSLAAGLPGG